MRVVDAFPEYPPYEGAFPELVPHLTIGHRCAPDDLRAAERDVRRHLPIDTSVEAVTLLVQESAAGRWTPRASFPLAAPPAG